MTNRTFTSEDSPRLNTALFSFTGIFRDALFEFNSFFMLLYVQLVSPIATSLSYTMMFFVISMVMIGSKILGGLCWSVASYVMENHHFKNGNYRSLTFIGAMLETVAFLMMFFVAPLFSGWAYVAMFLVFFTVAECVYSFNDIPYWAFLNTTTYNDKKRSAITSITNVLCAAGTYSVASISPAITSGNLKTNFTILAVALISAYFLTEMLYCFFLREREGVIPGAVGKDNTTKKGVFHSLTMLKDKNILLVNLAVLMLFLGQDCFIANSSIYFYYEYGYGSFGSVAYGNANISGGIISFFFSLVYGVGILAADYLFIYLQRWLGKKKLMLWAFSLMVVIYLMLYFFGFTAGNEVLLFILVFCLALCSGNIYMSTILNSVNSAEYFDEKYHENRDASVVALKALSIKSANGLQTGVFYIFLAVSGLLSINQQVAGIEAANSRGEISDVVSSVNETVHATDISSNLAVYKITLTFVPMVCIGLAVLIGCFLVPFTDEKKYHEITLALAERKKREADESIEK